MAQAAGCRAGDEHGPDSDPGDLNRSDPWSNHSLGDAIPSVVDGSLVQAVQHGRSDNTGNSSTQTLQLLVNTLIGPCSPEAVGPHEAPCSYTTWMVSSSSISDRTDGGWLTSVWTGHARIATPDASILVSPRRSVRS